mmetsp:Transcript_12177/g.34542  ORF Transcript_12177/g.34542 Transcript_12177/m.34542 type:complete len:152 (+) Transcript_12177:275-730(+)
MIENAPRRAVNSVRARPHRGSILLGRARQPVTCFGLRHVLIPNGDGDSGHLEFTFEDKTVSVIELGQGSYEVGREAETAEICLPIPTVSGRHALIRLEDDSLTLTDLGSTNGTYVNGKELERNVETAVKTSDVIVFGDGHLASFIYDASEE